MLAKFIESVLECVPGKWSMFNREHAPQFFGISACRVFIPIVLCMWLTLDICLFNSIRSSFFSFFFLFGRHLNRQGICFRCLYCCTYFCLSESHKSMAGEQKPSTDNFYAWHIDTISGGSVDALSTFVSTCPKCQSLLAGVIRSKCWESTWNGPPFARRLPRSQHK